MKTSKSLGRNLAFIRPRNAYGVRVRCKVRRIRGRSVPAHGRLQLADYWFKLGPIQEKTSPKQVRA